MQDNTSEDRFLITINCVVLGVNIPKNQKFVLSTSKNDIIFPSFDLDAQNFFELNKNIVEFLKLQMPNVSDLYLLPQLISFNSGYIETKTKLHINTIYGFVLDVCELNKEWSWIPFNDFEPHKYSNIIFEVIQKLY